jgi:hypothetical protein
MLQRKLAVVAAFLLGAVAVVGAQQTKGLLFPEFTPEKSTFEKPFGKLGEKPAQAWSVTTVAAAVDGKPLAGKVSTIAGEVVDYSCYLQLGKHGEKHRDCGQKCLKNGQPMGILTKEGTLYLLMEEEHNPRRDGMTTLRDACIEQMARVMEVTGTLSEVDGQRALFVHGYVKK